MRSKKDKSRKSNLVYSTDNSGGAAVRRCPACLRLVTACICKTKYNTPEDHSSTDGIIRLHRETKGRKGKGVTLVKGINLPDSNLNQLAKKLKSGCGVGGSIKAGVIELQTADRDKIKTLLENMDYTVKIAGG
jgi:translation initiation factor 1